MNEHWAICFYKATHYDLGISLQCYPSQSGCRRNHPTWKKGTMLTLTATLDPICYPTTHPLKATGPSTVSTTPNNLALSTNLTVTCFPDHQSRFYQISLVPPSILSRLYLLSFEELLCSVKTFPYQWQLRFYKSFWWKIVLTFLWKSNHLLCPLTNFLRKLQRIFKTSHIAKKHCYPIFTCEEHIFCPSLFLPSWLIVCM